MINVNADEGLYPEQQRSFFLVQTFSSNSVVYNAESTTFDRVFFRSSERTNEFSNDTHNNFLRSMAAAARPKRVNSWIPLISRNSARSTLEPFSAIIAGREIYGVFDSKRNTLESVLAGIQAVADNKVMLKRNADFPPQEARVPTRGWAEIRLGVFWSIADFRKELAGLFLRAVAAPSVQLKGNDL
mgnify:FL=1